MENEESILFSNTFGKLTNKRISLNYKSGVEDIPLKQVTSVSLKHERNYFFSLMSFFITFICLSLIISQRLGGPEFVVVFLVFIIAFLSGIANWFGHHNIIISTGGNDRKPLKVEMAKTKEGRTFVNAVRQALFN